MKRIKRYLALFLALAAVCNLLPAGSLAVTDNAENGMIVEESFEVGASFVADTTHTATYSTADAVVWNNAVPAQGSFLEVDPSTVVKHPVLSGNVSGAYHGSSCIGITIDAANYPDDTASVKNQNARAFIDYKLFANSDAMARMVDGATYIVSLWYKSSGTASGNGGGRATLGVVSKAAGLDEKTATVTRKTAWTKLELEFVYSAAYKNDIRIRINSGNANGGTICFDLLTLEAKDVPAPVVDTLVFEEDFQVGASFTAEGAASGVAMSKAYYGDYAQPGPYAAVWNGAKPTAASFVEAYWDSTTNYSNNYDQPALTLSAGVSDAETPAEQYITAQIEDRNGRAFINYNLYANSDAMAKLIPGNTYVLSIRYKSSGTSSGNGGGKAILRAVTAPASSESKDIIATTAAITRKTSWTELTLEFVYEEAYRQNLIIQLFTGNGNGGTLSIDKLKMEQKVELTVDPTDAYVETGKTLNLTAALAPAGVELPLSYESSDPNVAQVDDAGKVTGIAPGEAVITVSAGGNVTAQCAIHVVDTYVPLTGIRLNKTEMTVNLGHHEQLQLIKDPENATENRVFWESSDTSVVTVDQQGNIVSVSEGSATVTVKVGGFSAACRVSVEEADDFASTDAPLSVPFGGTAQIDLKTVLEGTEYAVVTQPAKGKATLSGSTVTYTASAALLENQKGEYIDRVYEDTLVVSVSNGTNSALITLNITIGKLGDLFYDASGNWSGNVTMMMTAEELAAIREELKDTGSLRYQLLLDLCRQADTLLNTSPVLYVKPAPDAKTSYDTNQTATGDNTMTFLMAYLFTKDLPGFEECNALYLQKTIDWVTASLQYPFWGTRGYQNQDLAAAHQLFSVSMVYHWLQEELKDVRIDHTMGTDGTTEEKWNETVKTENLPILRAMEKRLWQAGSDMYSRNLAGVNYTNNHINMRMGGLLAAATVLRQQQDLTADQQQTLINWTGEAIFKQAMSMDALQPDGTSHEGITYWAYGAQFLVRTNILAQQNFGFNMMVYYDLYRESATYVLYNTTAHDHWVSGGNVVCQLNFSDAHTYHGHGVSELLRYLAALYGDTTAQWLAGRMEEAGLAPNKASLWLSVVTADPAVQAVAPTTAETLKWFRELGLVISRSDWSGDESIVGIKTGTPAGVTLTERAQSGDYIGVVDAGHNHPDANHITLYANGEFLLRDDGIVDKYTSNHNTLLIGGKGQAGDCIDYIDEQVYISNGLYPAIKLVQSADGYDYIVGDATEAYPAELALELFERNVLYLKDENAMIVVDHIRTAKEQPLQLRWFPSSKTAIALGDYYRVISDKNTMHFYPFTRQASFMDVTAYGRGTSYNEKTFLQELTGTVWQNAVAFSWNDAGLAAADVDYAPGDAQNEHKFGVGGKIYTVNVSTNTVTVTEGSLSTGGDTTASDSSLAAVMLNGQVMAGFDPAVTEYTVDRWFADAADMNVNAYAVSGGALVTVDQSEKLVTITCVSADGSSTTTYTIHVTHYGKLTIVGAESDVTREGYDLASSYDGIVTTGNTGAYWTVQAPENGKIHVIYDLGAVSKITQVDLAFQNSKARTNYYDMLVSIDGVHWTMVQEDASADPTMELSGNNHAFRTLLQNGDAAGRYLQIVLRGNSANGKDKAGAFSGINEITVIGCQLHTLKLESNDSVTEFTVEGEKTHYEPVDIVTVTAKVADGKRFVKWEAEGVTLSDPTSVTVSFTMKADAELKAIVEEIPPETTEAETTAPETTEAETTAPETTEGETTAPETTEAETTAPDTTEGETTTPEATTEAPEATTEAPEVTTEALEATTEAPETTAAPETTVAPETSKPEEVTTITVKVSVPEGWENPGIWAWDNSGKNAFEAWPGLSLTKGEDGFWYATVPAWVENIIINANGGSVQTADLALAKTKVDVDVTVTLAADGSVKAELTYSSPETGDGTALYAMAMTSLLAAAALVTLPKCKRRFFA